MERSGPEAVPNQHSLESAELKSEREILANSLQLVAQLEQFIAADRDNVYPLATHKIIKHFQTLGATCREAEALERTTVRKFNYLLTAFVDIAIANSMTHDGTEFSGLRTRYGREIEDERRRGGTTEKAAFLQDQLFSELNEGIISELQQKLSDQVSVHNTVPPSHKYHVPELGESVETEFDHIMQLLSDCQDNRADRYYIRKLKVGLPLEEGEQSYFEAHHCEHYERFFTVSERVPTVHLTNSGSRSNEAIIAALAAHVGEDACAYFQHGWYYENERSIRDEIGLVDPADARVFFINEESSYVIGPEEYKAQTTALFETISMKAANKPEQQLYVVIDATCDLLGSEEFIATLPDNVTCIKTFSLTKHQRGGTNYFFGGMALWNAAPEIEAEVIKQISANNAALGIFETIHYPRLRPGEVQEEQENIHRAQVAFQAAFETAQQQLPPHFRCQQLPYNYFTYLRVPHVAQHHTEKFIREVETLNIEDFSVADSFGLDDTRLCRLHTKTEGQNARISFGRETTKEAARVIGEKLAAAWVNFIPTEEINWHQYSSDESLAEHAEHIQKLLNNIEHSWEVFESELKALKHFEAAGEEDTKIKVVELQKQYDDLMEQLNEASKVFPNIRRVFVKWLELIKFKSVLFQSSDRFAQSSDAQITRLKNGIKGWPTRVDQAKLANVLDTFRHMTAQAGKDKK